MSTQPVKSEKDERPRPPLGPKAYVVLQVAAAIVVIATGVAQFMPSIMSWLRTQGLF